jgi:hypothetical protein
MAENLAMRLTVNGKRRDFGLGPIRSLALIETPNASLALLLRLLSDADFRARVLSRVANPLTPRFLRTCASTPDSHSPATTTRSNRDMAFPRVRPSLRLV